MKFGKVLQQSMQLSPRAWEPFWVDYKLLKKIIKDCAQLSTEEKLRTKKVKPSAKEDNDSIRTSHILAGCEWGERLTVCGAWARAGNSEDETNFFRTLRDEIKKIATFFLKEQDKHATQIAAIEESFASLKVSELRIPPASRRDATRRDDAVLSACCAPGVQTYQRRHADAQTPPLSIYPFCYRRRGREGGWSHASRPGERREKARLRRDEMATGILTQFASTCEWTCVQSAAVPKDEDKTELMKACVSLYKELLLLENFAVMNFCGISKVHTHALGLVVWLETRGADMRDQNTLQILKKHDKWTGYATRSKFMHTILMKQPFATYEPLLRMIDRLEQIFMATTGSTIEQHDAQHSSSRRGDGGSSSGFDRRHSTGTDASGNAQHNPTHQPPVVHSGDDSNGTGSGAVDGAQQRRRAPNDSPSQEELSPRSDSSVTLVRVHALRSDVRELKKLESVSDYDGDGENEEDDAANDEEARFIYAGDDQAVAERFGGHVPGEGYASALPTLPAAQRRAAAPLKETHSDSDAAVIAMLSMKESLAGKTLSGASSDGGDSSSTEAGRGYKRKAYTPLDVEMNKRKMSVTAILN